MDMLKFLGGYVALIMLINLMFLVTLIFFGVKACHYIESGKAASDIQQIRIPVSLEGESQ